MTFIKKPRDRLKSAQGFVFDFDEYTISQICIIPTCSWQEQAILLSVVLVFKLLEENLRYIVEIMAYDQQLLEHEYLSKGDFHVTWLIGLSK